LLGQTDIEKHQVERLAGRHRERLLAIRDPLDRIGFVSQSLNDCATNHRVIFSQQYSQGSHPLVGMQAGYAC
jgi:hypothetical protein